MISGDLTVGRLLDEHPELIEVLASWHPHFEQFRNAQLRQAMASRLTLAQAASMAGVSADDLLATLTRALERTEPGVPPPPRSPAGSRHSEASVARTGAGRGEGGTEPRPAALAAVPESRQRHVDVREDIRLKREPFARIMAAVKALGPDDVLVLRAPFEPIPLYDVLGKRGLAHWAEPHAPDDWSVWFYPRTGAAPARATVAWGTRPARVVDVRGLEPPQPLVRILEELERLEPGQQIEVLHERRPMFLYPQLDDRGFLHETDEPVPGVVRIVIRAPEATA